MTTPSAAGPLDILRAYAAGLLGTCAAIERLELRDYADLLIALAQHDLGLPRPDDGSVRDARVRRASAILQPRLRHSSLVQDRFHGCGAADYVGGGEKS